jgi:hypothetical protein
MKQKIIALLLSILAATPLGAASIPGVEKLSYAWHLQGGVSWLAALMFPSSGHGTLETTQARTVSSRLSIRSNDSRGFYLYESEMLPDGTTTLTSRDAYGFRNSQRDERVAYDVANGVARVDKTTGKGREIRLHRLESSTPQDVLTAIYYLRQHASEIRAPKQAEVYSGPKPYDVLFDPKPATTMRVGGSDVRVRPFAITSVGRDTRRFPGEVRVWLTDDERRVPVRIDIDQKFATLKLDLE